MSKVMSQTLAEVGADRTVPVAVAAGPVFAAGDPPMSPTGCQMLTGYTSPVWFLSMTVFSTS